MCERFQLQEILFLWTVQQFLKYHYQKAFTWFCWHICGLYPTPEGALKWPFSWYKATEFFRTSKTLTTNDCLLHLHFIWCDVRSPNKTPLPFNSQGLNSQYITTKMSLCLKKRSKIMWHFYLQCRKVSWLRQLFPMPCIISSRSDFWFNLTIFRNSF